jgi:hypothetical protein
MFVRWRWEVAFVDRPQRRIGQKANCVPNSFVCDVLDLLYSIVFITVHSDSINYTYASPSTP